MYSSYAIQSPFLEKKNVKSSVHHSWPKPMKIRRPEMIFIMSSFAVKGPIAHCLNALSTLSHHRESLHMVTSLLGIHISLDTVVEITRHVPGITDFRIYPG